MFSYVSIYFLCFGPRLSGVKTEEIGKGRILADLRDILRDFWEILPLQNSKKKQEKPEKLQEKPGKN